MLRAFAAIISIVVLSSCTGLEANRSASAPDRAVTSPATLVGAWEVTSTRASRGVGKNLLTFSSDGTFFRSGDSHPVLSGAHGAWKLVGPNLYNASYVAFGFDQNGKWIGISRNNLQLVLGTDGNEFTGTVKSSNRDLQENVMSAGTATLVGKRIQVQPF
jgi:hypothetical protein